MSIHHGLTRFINCVRSARERAPQRFGKQSMQLLLISCRQTCDRRTRRHALDERASSLFTFKSENE
jgi:hypothetical protein